MRYRRIQKGEPGYELVENLKKSSSTTFVCDASTHNSRQGCSNPKCFKYKGKAK